MPSRAVVPPRREAPAWLQDCSRTRRRTRRSAWLPAPRAPRPLRALRPRPAGPLACRYIRSATSFRLSLGRRAGSGALRSTAGHCAELTKRGRPAAPLTSFHRHRDAPRRRSTTPQYSPRETAPRPRRHHEGLHGAGRVDRRVQHLPRRLCRRPADQPAAAGAGLHPRLHPERGLPARRAEAVRGPAARRGGLRAALLDADATPHPGGQRAARPPRRPRRPRAAAGRGPRGGGVNAGRGPPRAAAAAGCAPAALAVTGIPARSAVQDHQEGRPRARRPRPQQRARRRRGREGPEQRQDSDGAVDSQEEDRHPGAVPAAAEGGADQEAAAAATTATTATAPSSAAVICTE